MELDFKLEKNGWKTAAKKEVLNKAWLTLDKKKKHNGKTDELNND